MKTRRRWAAGQFTVVMVALLLVGSSGCTTYLRHRAEDLLEVADVGITLSYKPGLALWFAAPFSLGAGIGGHVDGYFLGLGGGRLGFTRHYLNAWGLIAFGHETIGWGDFDLSDDRTLYRSMQGAAGIPLALWHGSPAYTPTCNHEIHLGFIGAVGNLRYMEIADFVLGWALIDIGGDDGRKMGKWPWKPKSCLPDEPDAESIWSVWKRKKAAQGVPRLQTTVPVAKAPPAPVRAKPKPASAAPKSEPAASAPRPKPAMPRPRPRPVAKGVPPMTLMVPRGPTTLFAVYAKGRAPLGQAEAARALREGLVEALDRAECQLIPAHQTVQPRDSVDAFSPATEKLASDGYLPVATGQAVCRLITATDTSRGKLYIVRANVTVTVDGGAFGPPGIARTLTAEARDAFLDNKTEAARRARAKAAQMVLGAVKEAAAQ
jgi:hypothetical protein